MAAPRSGEQPDVREARHDERESRDAAHGDQQQHEGDERLARTARGAAPRGREQRDPKGQGAFQATQDVLDEGEYLYRRISTGVAGHRGRRPALQGRTASRHRDGHQRTRRTRSRHDLRGGHDLGTARARAGRRARSDDAMFRQLSATRGPSTRRPSPAVAETGAGRLRDPPDPALAVPRGGLGGEEPEPADRSRHGLEIPPNVRRSRSSGSRAFAIGSRPSRWISIDGAPTGGTFALTFTRPGTNPPVTDRRAGSCRPRPAADVQTALAALTGDRCRERDRNGRAAPDDSPITVTFQDALDSQDHGSAEGDVVAARNGRRRQ